MTPLAARLRNVTADTRKTRKARAARGLLLSYRECAAVLALLDAAKAVKGWQDKNLMDFETRQMADAYWSDRVAFADAVAALEAP